MWPPLLTQDQTQSRWLIHWVIPLCMQRSSGTPSCKLFKFRFPFPHQSICSRSLPLLGEAKSKLEFRLVYCHIRQGTMKFPVHVKLRVNSICSVTINTTVNRMGAKEQNWELQYKSQIVQKNIKIQWSRVESWRQHLREWDAIEVIGSGLR